MWGDNVNKKHKLSKNKKKKEKERELSTSSFNSIDLSTAVQGCEMCFNFVYFIRFGGK